MGISYTTEVDGDTLMVRASGFDESLEEVQAYGNSVIRGVLAEGVSRVLCDERELEYRLSLIDTYQVAQAVAEVAPSVVRVAIVCSPTAVTDAAFFEDVAVNRGLTLRVFTDLASAKRWVQER